MEFLKDLSPGQKIALGVVGTGAVVAAGSTVVLTAGGAALVYDTSLHIWNATPMIIDPKNLPGCLEIMVNACSVGRTGLYVMGFGVILGLVNSDYQQIRSCIVSGEFGTIPSPSINSESMI